MPEIAMPNIRVLMVTRENGLDKRYGLGKSLLPIINEMQASGIPIFYLSQTDAGQRGLDFCRKIHKFLSLFILPILRKKHLSGLLWGIIERINMGRLAVLVSRREQITHVHCHDPAIAFGFKLFKKLFFLRRRIKWGLTEHGYGSYAQAVHEDGCELSSRSMSYLRKKEACILHSADWVIAPTKLALQQLARDLSVYPLPSHWFSIPHPAPVMPEQSYTKSREHLGWKSDTFYILAVGRLVPLKQFSLLLQACSELEHNNFKIIILGDGNSESLYQQAQQLGLQDCLHITTTDEIEYYYAAADLYVSCSATESFGYANLEALTMGLAVISTAVGGCTEVISNGGWLVPVDKFAIRHAINTVISDFSFRMELSKRALQWSSNWPSIKRVTSGYLSVYQSQQISAKLLAELSVTPKQHIDNNVCSNRNNTRLFECLSSKLNQLPLVPEIKELVVPEKANIVVAVPHPDDETIWCGATLAKLSARSCRISAILFTDGELGDPLNLFPNESIGERRYDEFKRASHYYGINNILRLQQADGNYRISEQIKLKITIWLEQQQADWIFIPHLLDAHRDHVLVSLTILELWGQLDKLKLKKYPRLFFYDGLWPTQVNSYVDVSNNIDIKKKAIKVYKIPLACVDYMNLSQYLNQYRGLSLANCEFAEAFFEITEENYNDILKSMVDLRLKL